MRRSRRSPPATATRPSANVSVARVHAALGQPVDPGRRAQRHPHRTVREARLRRGRAARDRHPGAAGAARAADRLRPRAARQAGAADRGAPGRRADAGVAAARAGRDRAGARRAERPARPADQRARARAPLHRRRRARTAHAARGAEGARAERRARGSPAERQASLDRMLVALDRTIHLAEQMLAFNRASASAAPEHKPVSLRQLAGEAIETLQPRIARARLEGDGDVHARRRHGRSAGRSPEAREPRRQPARQRRALRARRQRRSTSRCARSAAR